jgi:2,4-dienoyl-CoA reductase-like NADH-dependent reductase (Old Yellow Enzyme family)
MDTLFTPYDMAGLAIRSRVVMAPMTRARAANGVADALTATYYRQRASAGLIISESIAVSPQGEGYLFTPGLYTDEQTHSWKQVTDAVHAEGGRIFAQLWHVGRVSHTTLQHRNAPPVAPVARRAQDTKAYAWEAPGVPGQVDTSEPRALASEEVTAIVADFVAAGERAMRAGFDGVEVHAANGYLFEQFINGELNTREDHYGGSIANRLRLLLETVDALSDAIGAQNVGVRITPFGRQNDLQGFEDEVQTWLALAAELGQRAPAYIHLSDSRVICEDDSSGFFSHLRKAYAGTLIVAGGFDQCSAEQALVAGKADLIGFGSPFIANPDLVERMAHGWPLAQPDRETLYGLHGARGYTDYPRYADQAESESSTFAVREALGRIRDNFFAAWAGRDWQSLESVIVDKALLSSSQHGVGEGIKQWQQMLATDAATVAWMRTSNHAIVLGQNGRAAGSAYVMGLLGTGRQQLLFGASVVLDCQFTGAAWGWKLAQARIQVNWCKGDEVLVSHWRQPPEEGGWQLGDPPPVITSELDSPWASLPDTAPAPALQDAMVELYSKYSWAIDQGDIALLTDCYTDDAAGGFAPMGPLESRHAIIGQLKSFRRLWPWMQHFADVLRVELEPDGRHARMIVARIIPERPVDTAGNSVYGAHYQIRARREADGQWRICWSDYRPGWFNGAHVPEFEIGITHA